MELQKILYKNRFGNDIDFRDWMWRTLCEHFFQRYVPEDASLVDVGSGYCEFINNIRCAKKVAIDINPDTKKFAGQGVEFITDDSADMKALRDGSADVVFANNFFEHLTKEKIVATLKEVWRILKPRGRILLLQPNIRYCWRDYWMFFDHITPLDDRSIREILEATGFRVTECKVRFLPYTMKGYLRKFAFLLKVYLKVPLLQWLFGQQSFIVAERRK